MQQPRISHRARGQVRGAAYGTVRGVVIVPGLYDWFGRLAEGTPLTCDEHETPLTERVRHDG